MKAIKLYMDDTDYNELALQSDEMSLNELKRLLLVQSIRENRKKLEKINQQYGLDKLSEEDILSAVNEAKAEYYAEKKSKEQ